MIMEKSLELREQGLGDLILQHLIALQEIIPNDEKQEALCRQIKTDLLEALAFITPCIKAKSKAEYANKSLLQGACKEPALTKGTNQNEVDQNLQAGISPNHLEYSQSDEPKQQPGQGA